MNSKKIIFLFERKTFFKKKNNKKQKLKYLCFPIIFILIIILFKLNIKRIYNINNPNNINNIKKEKEKVIINEQDNKANKELRKQMLNLLSEKTKKRIISLDNVYVGSHYRLGNSLLALNKVIYYCEILQCKNIFLNKHYYPYIKNTIYDKKFNLTIEVLTNSKNINIKSLFHWPYPYYTILKKIPENRFEVFKEEILKNLPKPSININDLYIHIRNGDIYRQNNWGNNMAQPPLCFYKKVIEFKNFTNIYIIAENDDYPIIKRLISEYKNVKYKQSPLIEDVSKLVYAYNIVASISSFFVSLIKLNDNLKYCWEYDIYHRVTKFNHLHYSISNFTRKYIIYQMKPSPIYKKIMYKWRRQPEQIDLMINDTCPYGFIIIKPNI